MYEEVKHPCIQHKLALIRDVGTGHKMFRELATEITMFVCYEALKNIKVKEVDVETPLAVAKCQMIDEDIVVIPILFAFSIAFTTLIELPEVEIPIKISPSLPAASTILE